MPQLFDDEREEWDEAREQLRELAGERGYEAARRTTINAHYTDPQIAGAIWQTVHDLGFTGGRVLETGCGAGIFLGLAPEDAELTGVELGPTTAQVARALYPHATIRTSRSPLPGCLTATSTWRSGTSRSRTCAYTTRGTTRAGTACTTTSSSNRFRSPARAGSSRCLPRTTRLARATRRHAGR